MEEVVATSCDGESARRGIGKNLAGETGVKRHVGENVNIRNRKQKNVRTRV